MDQRLDEHLRPAFAMQAAAFGLAALVTLSVMSSLDMLAMRPLADEQLAASPTAPAQAVAAQAPRRKQG